MNIANKLTVSRILLTFVYLILLFIPGLLYKVSALLVFMLACISDYLDGYIARKNGMVTNFGIIMDPVADKILVLGSFLAFVELGLIPFWMALIIVIREVTVTALRIFALSKGKVLKAEKAGKHKTVSQMAAIIIILVFLLLNEFMRSFSFWPEFERFSSVVIYFSMAVAVVLTTVSGIHYFSQNRSLFLKT